MQEKLREKSDGFNELVIKKELADRQVLIQEEEIKHLEETNANIKRQVAQLQEELEKQKKMVKKLQVKQLHPRSAVGGWGGAGTAPHSHSAQCATCQELVYHKSSVACLVVCVLLTSCQLSCSHVACLVAYLVAHLACLVAHFLLT